MLVSFIVGGDYFHPMPVGRSPWHPESLWAYHPFEKLAGDARSARLTALSALAIGGASAAFVVLMVASPGGGDLLASFGVILLLVPLLLAGLPLLQFKVEAHALPPEAYEEGLLVADARVFSWRATRTVEWKDVTLRDVGAPDAQPGGPARSFGTFHVEARVGDHVVFERAYSRHSTIGESDSEGLYEVLLKRAIHA